MANPEQPDEPGVVPPVDPEKTPVDEIPAEPSVPEAAVQAPAQDPDEGRAGGAGLDSLLPLATPAVAESLGSRRAEERSESRDRTRPAEESSEPAPRTEMDAPTAPASTAALRTPEEPSEELHEAEEEPQTARRRILSRFAEPPEEVRAVPELRLRRQTRRDFLLFGAGTAAAAAAFWWVLPDGTQDRILTQERREWLDSMEARGGFGPKAKEKFLNRALTFDDDVAEALYSRGRRVRTYRKSDITPLRNNYDGQTPDPDYIPDWTLEVGGLASGRKERFRIDDLLSKFRRSDEITRLCCVEGWSAIAWWGGVRFADFLQAYPPAPGFRWAKLESSVNLDSDGESDPYFVSIDLETARHPQTLLATHQNDRPLTVEHGAPLRLLVPMKLGLKNIKAVTKIAYSREEPPDYWNLQGYSKYDGL